MQHRVRFYEVGAPRGSTWRRGIASAEALESTWYRKLHPQKIESARYRKLRPGRIRFHSLPKLASAKDQNPKFAKDGIRKALEFATSERSGIVEYVSFRFPAILDFPTDVEWLIARLSFPCANRLSPQRSSSLLAHRPYYTGSSDTKGNLFLHPIRLLG